MEQLSVILNISTLVKTEFILRTNVGMKTIDFEALVKILLNIIKA